MKLADCRLKSPSPGFNINAKQKEFEKKTLIAIFKLFKPNFTGSIIGQT